MTTTVIVGTLTEITANFINPYTGDILELDGEYYVNNDYYDGGPGSSDTILGTSVDQLYTIEDANGNLLIENYETILPADGDDVVIMSSDTFTTSNLSIQGLGGNDIIWSNVGGMTCWAVRTAMIFCMAGRVWTACMVVPAMMS